MEHSTPITAQLCAAVAEDTIKARLKPHSPLSHPSHFLLYAAIETDAIRVVIARS